MDTIEVKKATALRGGEFIVKESNPADVFIREELNEEQQMIGQMCQDLIEAEIDPNLDRIDHQEEGLVPSLLDKAGELGILGMAIPEEYGGFGKDVNTNTLVTEVMGGAHSFAVALSAHTGIGTLPILYFGTEAQKAKYLPGLATGALKASYCLTEPGSGSDALGAKTKAVLTEDGQHYILNGQKMWITNAGFADVFIVFAKIDGEKFTGFIVEKGTPGLSLGAEEHKLGIKGSSTRQVFFQDCKIPAENLLGKIGEGHKIAFNILNIGRYKLCAAAVGGSKGAITTSVRYANERNQFNQPISSFGAIKYKLAEQTIRTWAAESITYRTSDLINNKEHELIAAGKPQSEALLAAAEEYSIECAILKFFGSEVLDYVVDELVQIHGGYGFSEEYPAARAYRDSRINRIFEGTNEINRLLTVDMLVRKAMGGKIDLMSPAMAVQKELMSVPDFGGDEDTSRFAAEKKALKNAKKAVLMAAGAAFQKLMQKMKDEQEIVMDIADMIAEVFACESMLLRAEKLIDLKGEAEAAIYGDMTRVYFSDAFERINLHGKHALAAFAEGDELRMMLMGLKRFTKYDIVNTKELRRKVADKLIADNKYSF
ncbi:MAG: acyl-CoA dehydrogenase family protein [Chitinophagales bacterium]|nr:acyl-CoA dehydrogenase family protein [Chitinophagales bacterium]